MATKAKTLRERDVEKYLVKRVKALGGEVRKVRWIGRRSAPDRLVLIPGHVPVFLELKAPGKVPTPAQQRELTRLLELGMCAVWADTPAGVDAAIFLHIKPEAHR